MSLKGLKMMVIVGESMAKKTSSQPNILFDITYRGNHTCSQAGNSVQPPTSPQNQDQKPNTTNNNNSSVVQQPQLENKLGPYVPSELRVVTEDLDKREAVTSSFSFPSSSYDCFKVEEDGFGACLGLENEAFLGGFSQHFASPATPESTYYSVSPFQVNNSAGFHCRGVHRSESDLTEIISANTSATNSPILELDFSLDQVEIDPNFPFDAPGFFP